MRSDALVLALLLFPLAAQEPVFRVPVRLVIAPTSVTDQHGKFINGIQSGDFSLFDNDIAQKVHEDADFLPISLAVAIQSNLTIQAVLPKIHELGPLLGTLVVGDGGECAILTFDKQVHTIQDFTGDLGRLTRALHQLEFSQTKSHLVDATLEAIHLLKSRPEGRRRILLLISETRDQGSESKLRDVVAEAELHNILIYSLNINRIHAVTEVIGEHDLIGMIQELYGGVKTMVVENPLSVLTRYTGGRQYSFIKEHALEDAVTKIGEEIHGQYLLSYVPANTPTSGYHRIRVQVARRDVEVRSRPGYYSWTQPLTPDFPTH